ncbi:hypothetical protein PV325_002655 [Microctonus aethiopoides]|nr:hypothetical protein PV325_002655 [Microctonus aethiopoides]
MIDSFTLEACGRLLCCVQRLCGSGSRVDEGEPRQPMRSRRGAQDLEGPSGPEDGILPVPVSPSPASTSSQEDSCKPPPRNCYRLIVLGSARVGKTAIVARRLMRQQRPKHWYQSSEPRLLDSTSSFHCSDGSIIVTVFIFLSNKFEESYTPTIEDFHRKLYRIRGEVHQLDLLDTSGNHPFPAMRRLSFLTGNGDDSKVVKECTPEHV